MAKRPDEQDYKSQYVLLPVRGTHSSNMEHLDVATSAFGRTLRARLKASSAGGSENSPAPNRKAISIVHSASTTGAKLAELTPQELATLRVQEPSVRAVPVVTYHLTRTPRLAVASQAKRKGNPQKPLRIKVVDQMGAPVAGALVVALNDAKQRIGDDAATNKRGEATLHLPSGPNVEVLAVYADVTGHWGEAQMNVRLLDGYIVTLSKVDLAVDDFVSLLYSKPKVGDGAGVVVGVVDSGVDNTHPDLNVNYSRACVSAEGDAGDGSPASVEGEHGTHVAGLIAGALRVANKHSGRAPAATLNSYRVFPNGGGDATNYDILRAIEAAVADGCDLINLSLGTATPDEAVRDAIKEAFDLGTVCIAAAGNDGREDLLFPARWSEVISITALGQKGTYPTSSVETLAEATPYSTLDKKRFAALFTNVGPEVTAAAPGVGIVSTLPGGAYGTMSGTSMACPVACGMLAAALARKPEILALPRGPGRSVEIQRLFFTMCKPAGFHREFEGQGLPQ